VLSNVCPKTPCAPTNDAHGPGGGPPVPPPVDVFDPPVDPDVGWLVGCDVVPPAGLPDVVVVVAVGSGDGFGEGDELELHAVAHAAPAVVVTSNAT
jgi:hypothetical protein